MIFSHDYYYLYSGSVSPTEHIGNPGALRYAFSLPEVLEAKLVVPQNDNNKKEKPSLEQTINLD
jgi:hypothetical protein